MPQRAVHRHELQWKWIPSLTIELDEDARVSVKRFEVGQYYHKEPSSHRVTLQDGQFHAFAAGIRRCVEGGELVRPGTSSPSFPKNRRLMSSQAADFEINT